MKTRLSWIIGAVTLVSIGSLIVPRLRYWFPSSETDASETARAELATPDAVVTSMFLMTDQGGESESDNPHEVITDRLNDAHLVTGKDMTPEEQKFAALFLNHERSGAIYNYLRGELTKSANITAANVAGDSAVVSVAVKVYLENGSDWVDSTCTVELKKKGRNWYVDELKSPRMPGGLYQRYKQRMGYSN
jgi:hypothetical protein